MQSGSGRDNHQSGKEVESTCVAACLPQPQEFDVISCMDAHDQGLQEMATQNISLQLHYNTKYNNIILESLSMPALNAYPPWRVRRGIICVVPKSTSYPIISWSLSIVGMVEEISQLRCGVRQVLGRQFLRGGRTLKLSIQHPS